MPVSKATAAEQQTREHALTPYWQSECGRAVVYLGDCREVMDRMEPDLFHAVVTDPPYGLEFDVGQVKGDWDAPWKHTQAYLRHNIEYVRDGQAFQAWFETCAAAILRSAKTGAFMLSFGGTRMWHRMACAVEDAGWEVRDTIMWVYSSGYPKGKDISKDIDRVLGVEREVIGVAKMVDTTKVRPGFTGAAHSGDNVGATRYVDMTAPATDAAKQWDGWNTTLKPAWEPALLSRKPFAGSVAQNVLDNGCGGLNVDDCAVGDRKLWPANLVHDGADDQLSRYFYCAKAGAAPDNRPHGKGHVAHPTVKPLDLMCYLVRLVCARGGTVLDPFMGSGSTGVAAIMEGMKFVGIEQSREYADIAVGRLKLAMAEAPPLEELRAGRRAASGVECGPPPAQELR